MPPSQFIPLAEETGLRAGRMEHLGRLDLASGLLTQRFDVWRATDLTPGPTARMSTTVRISISTEAAEA